MFAVYFKAIVRWAFTRSQAELSPPAPPPDLVSPPLTLGGGEPWGSETGRVLPEVTQPGHGEAGFDPRSVWPQSLSPEPLSFATWGEALGS